MSARVSTTREEQLALVRQKCVVAQIGTQREVELQDNWMIRLTDVLLAIEASGLVRGTVGQKANVRIDNFKTIEEAREYARNHPEIWVVDIQLSDAVKQVVITWNLRKDDLTEQSNECINFLAELLK